MLETGVADRGQCQTLASLFEVARGLQSSSRGLPPDRPYVALLDEVYDHVPLLRSTSRRQDLSILHRATEYLVRTTADLQYSGGVKSLSLLASLLRFLRESRGQQDKPDALASAHERLYKLHKRLQEQRDLADYGPKEAVEVLIITALPLEFLAVVRRMSQFIAASYPSHSRGFRMRPREEEDGLDLGVGWVRGLLKDGRNTAVVMVVCGSRYGPAGAASATQQVPRGLRPQHILGVGIAASLGDASSLDLGDLGLSTAIDDVSLGKDQQQIAMQSPRVRFVSAPKLDRLPSDLRDALLIQGQDLFLRGLLPPDRLDTMLGAFDQPEDREACRTLVAQSRKVWEDTNLQETRQDRPCSVRALEVAREVVAAGNWRDRIHVQRPGGRGGAPKVVETRVLSGSHVVKQFGMREYLRSSFPENLLLEMEAAGIAQACIDSEKTERPLPHPLIMKAACDWATPDKNKVWQTYSADVAAAFSVELAFALANPP